MDLKPVILFYNFCSKMGGAEIVLLEFLKRPSGHFRYKVLLNEYGEFYDRLVKNNIYVDVLHTNAKLFYSIKREMSINFRFISAIPSSLHLLFNFLCYIRTNKVDLVISNTFKSHIIAGITALLMRQKVAWRFHDIIQRESSVHYFSWMNIFLMKLVSLRVSKIIGVSNAVINSFKDYGFKSSKLSVVYNGLDHSSNKGELIIKNRDKIKIGWIGRFAPWKGIREFIILAERLIYDKNKINSEFEFIIAGSALFDDGDYEKTVKNHIAKPLKKYFTFLGYIEDIDTFYNQIDIYFHTSIAPDPFPTTILEAGQRGLVVFASDKGGGKEIIKENKTGILINMFDLDDVVIKSIFVMNNLEIYRVKGECLKNIIKENYSLDKYYKGFVSELLNLI
ncbi:glycosyltransferase family 4 protein [Candidatus Marinimicrobia bacterium]|nr:glycosyltransferase family 4 protein [Candidatus Neomarinimicrobiota bacterium]